MKKFVFEIAPSKIVDIILGEEGNENRVLIPRYFHQVDKVIRDASHFKKWEAEKEKKIAIKFFYTCPNSDENYEVVLILKGRPDFYDIQQGVLIEQKKQPIPPFEDWEKFSRDVSKAAFQASIYAFVMNIMGESIKEIRLHFVWPSSCISDKIIIDGVETPVVDAIRHKNYVCRILWGEKEMKETYERLYKIGFILLQRKLNELQKNQKQKMENN